ncbi:hypothetical protein ACFQU3_19860 [Terrabacter sp. GCM10028922]|uniref:hypothetical protein n=1 Tax=Terrabacter sp. GCM10028922 TaxID=3273428 RepID=UPI00361222B7
MASKDEWARSRLDEADLVLGKSPDGRTWPRQAGRGRVTGPSTMRHADRAVLGLPQGLDGSLVAPGHVALPDAIRVVVDETAPPSD